MPIDVGKVAGARLPDLKSSWDEETVILYHIGIGAGNPPTSESELTYCYEANLKVLPASRPSRHRRPLLIFPA